jgi:hypothetical protein
MAPMASGARTDLPISSQGPGVRANPRKKGALTLQSAHLLPCHRHFTRVPQFHFLAAPTRPPSSQGPQPNMFLLLPAPKNFRYWTIEQPTLYIFTVHLICTYINCTIMTSSEKYVKVFFKSSLTYWKVFRALTRCKYGRRQPLHNIKQYRPRNLWEVINLSKDTHVFYALYLNHN